MSEECTTLAVEGVFYDTLTDEIFIFDIPVTHLEMTFYNEDFKHTNDIKKIKIKGHLNVATDFQGVILLGSIA